MIWEFDFEQKNQRIMRMIRKKEDWATDLCRRIIQKDLQIPDAEIRHPDIPHLTSPDQLLHLLPRLDKVPIRKVFLQIRGIG
jgi:hypothetical protein